MRPPFAPFDGVRRGPSWRMAGLLERFCRGEEKRKCCNKSKEDEREGWNASESR